jgi:hypothetical protein
MSTPLGYAARKQVLPQLWHRFSYAISVFGPLRLRESNFAESLLMAGLRLVHAELARRLDEAF